VTWLKTISHAELSFFAVSLSLNLLVKGGHCVGDWVKDGDVKYVTKVIHN